MIASVCTNTLSHCCEIHCKRSQTQSHAAVCAALRSGRPTPTRCMQEFRNSIQYCSSLTRCPDTPLISQLHNRTQHTSSCFAAHYYAMHFFFTLGSSVVWCIIKLLAPCETCVKLHSTLITRIGLLRKCFMYSVFFLSSRASNTHTAIPDSHYVCLSPASRCVDCEHWFASCSAVRSGPPIRFAATMRNWSGFTQVVSIRSSIVRYFATAFAERFTGAECASTNAVKCKSILLWFDIKVSLLALHRPRQCADGALRHVSSLQHE